MGVVDGRVGVFGRERLEGDGVGWRLDDEEGGDDTAEGVFNLRELADADADSSSKRAYHKHNSHEEEHRRRQHHGSPGRDIVLDLVAMFGVDGHSPADEGVCDGHDGRCNERRW